MFNVKIYQFLHIPMNKKPKPVNHTNLYSHIITVSFLLK